MGIHSVSITILKFFSMLHTGFGYFGDHLFLNSSGHPDRLVLGSGKEYFPKITVSFAPVGYPYLGFEGS